MWAIQRPSAAELLQHRFIRGGRKTAGLTELIERYQDWQARREDLGKSRSASNSVPTIKMSASEAARTVDLDNGTIGSAWSFDTVRSISTLGSVRDVRHILNLDPQEEDEDDYDEEGEEYRMQAEVERSLAAMREQIGDGLGDVNDETNYDDDFESDYSTSRAVAGTMDRPRIGELGLNRDATHSTMQIQVRDLALVLCILAVFPVKQSDLILTAK